MDFVQFILLLHLLGAGALIGAARPSSAVAEIPQPIVQIV